MKRMSFVMLSLVVLAFLVVGQSENVLAGGRVVSSVTGSGHFTTGGEYRTFSFTAHLHADGSVSGQWQGKNRSLGWLWHGEVTCLSIDGNQAWIGGVTTIATSGTPEVGGETGFRVVDNGQGRNSIPDQISLQFVNGGPGFAQSYCGDKPLSPDLADVEGGNIQIRE